MVNKKLVFGISAIALVSLLALSAPVFAGDPWTDPNTNPPGFAGDPWTDAVLWPDLTGGSSTDAVLWPDAGVIDR